MKALKDWRLSVVIVTFLLILGLGLSAQYGFRTYNVIRPLGAEFKKIAGVEDFSLEGRGGLTVQLGEVDDLYRTVQEITAAGRQTLGSDLETLVIRDKRDIELSEIYYRIHFEIQQGLATGQFTAMARAIDNMLTGMGLTNHRITVTSDYVFIQLHSARAYLYEAIPRRESVQLAIRVEGGKSG